MEVNKDAKRGFYQEDYHSPSSVLCTLFLFSAAMFTLPIAAYFGTIYLLDRYYHIPQSESYIYAVIVAVVTVHLILFTYIYIAYHEDKKDNAKIIKDKTS